MAWVKVTKDYDYKVPGRAGRSILAFKAGTETVTTKEAVEAIVAAGAGEAIDHPEDRKSSKDGKTVFLKDA